MAVFFAVLAAGAVLLVAYEGTRQWPPAQLTEVMAVAFAVPTGYGAGLTVPLSEFVTALVDAAKVVEHEAVAPIKAVAHDLAGKES